MARRKLVSEMSACCACRRRRVWRQLAINIHAVIMLRELTSQNWPLPISPNDARYACARMTRPVPTGETGILYSWGGLDQGANALTMRFGGMAAPASSPPFASNRDTAYCAVTSGGSP